MNNYSAHTTTEEVIELLRGILERADECLGKLDKERQDSFAAAKKFAYDTIQDDARLIGLLENYGQFYSVNSYFSNYSRWERSSFLSKWFVPEPFDDRVGYKINALKDAANSARYAINKILDDTTTLTKFYNMKNRFELRIAYGRGWVSNYTEHQLITDIITTQMPDSMEQRNSEISTFNKNVKKIREMYQEISIHKFQSVTIEEDMLGIIDSVQNEIS